MKRLMTILIILFLISGCNNPKDGTVKENAIQELTLKVDRIKSNNLDTIKSTGQIKDTINDQSQNQLYDKKKKKEMPISFDRYIEFPGDDVWNGKPMRQQIEMSSNILNNFQDTLSRLAVARYKTYDQFFPRSIADNFEDGVSTEFIEYPKKIIFQFQVFEDKYQSKPYLIKEIIIRRNENGEPYAE